MPNTLPGFPRSVSDFCIGFSILMLAAVGALLIKKLLSRSRQSSSIGYQSMASQRPPASSTSNLPTLEMIRIEPGTFLIGDPKNGDAGTLTDDRQHQVTLSRAYLIGKYQVTVAEFANFVAQTGFQTSGEKKGGSYVHADKPQRFRPEAGLNWRTASVNLSDQVPVVCVSWNDANAFCEWVQSSTGKKTRLPTEAEWEYACRAGTQSTFSVEGPPSSFGWFSYNSGDHLFDSQMLGQRTFVTYKGKVRAEHCGPHPVGQKKPNLWGLYDMHGNVWEWCRDIAAPYPDQAATDPTGPDDPNAKYRIARGGDWFDTPSTAASYNRGWWVAQIPYYHVGFRIVQELTP
jgi:formylglycine-generating enzyme